MQNQMTEPPARLAARLLPSPPRRGRILAALAGVAALGVAGLTAAWLAAGVALDGAVDDWRAGLAARGGAAAAAQAVGGGFPFTARRRFADVVATDNGWRLTAGEAEIAYSLFRPDAATLSLRRVQLVAPDGTVTTAAQVEATATLTQRPLAGGGAAPQAISARLDGATWRDWRAETLTATLRFPDSPPADHTQPGLTLAVAAEGAAPPPALAALVGPPDDRGRWSAAATLNGPPPAPIPAALEAWRTDGGTVELSAIKLNYGTLQADGDGTLALDRDLQWIGAGSLRIAGADAALAHAAQQSGGPLRPQDIRQARQIVALLTQPDPQGGAPLLTLPLSSQGGRLFVGPFQVAKLPRVMW